MHGPISVLRIILMTLAIFVVVVESGALIVAIDSPGTPTFPMDPDKVARPLTEPLPANSRLRSWFGLDVQTNDALLLAFDALGSNAADGKNNRAQTATKQALMTAPASGRLWLCLALLQQRTNENRQATEALKMAYFVTPNDAELMPTRLDAATRGTLLRDEDLRQLARGDVRQMLRAANLKSFLVRSYRRASPEGQAFLQKTIGELDPTVLWTLRG